MTTNAFVIWQCQWHTSFLLYIQLGQYLTYTSQLASYNGHGQARP
jgi:hypothetical protein